MALASSLTHRRRGPGTDREAGETLGVAPPIRHPSPLQQLSELAARARSERLAFQEFWTRALRPGSQLVLTTTPSPPTGAVRFPTDAKERRSWQAALVATQDGWRWAYEGAAPTGPEAALVLLGPWLSEFEDLDRERGSVPPPVAA